MKGTARELSNAARIWLVANDVCPPFANQVVIEGSGVLDTDRWVKAVKIASAANPGSRLILKGHVGFSHWVDSGISPPVKVVDAEAWDGQGSHGADWFQSSFSARQGPTAEVVLMHGDPLRVAFRSHHAIMDGRGTMTWAEDIFRALRDEPVLGSDFCLTENALLNISNDTIHKSIAHRFIAPTGWAEGEERGVVWRRTRLKGRFPKLLMQILLLTAQEAWKMGQGKVRLGIPVDLRPRRSGLRSTGNLTNALFVEITPETTLAGLSDEVSERLKARSDGQLTLEDKLIRHIPLRILGAALNREAMQSHRSGNYRYSGFVSNMGRFSMEGFQGGGFQAHMYWAVPVCLESIPFSLVISGVGEYVDLILAMPRVLASGGRLEQILDHIATGLVPE